VQFAALAPKQTNTVPREVLAFSFAYHLVFPVFLLLLPNIKPRSVSAFRSPLKNIHYDLGALIKSWAEPEERSPVPPTWGLVKMVPKTDWLEFYDIQTHQNWTHQELILHISPFSIHIYLIRHRNNLSTTHSFMLYKPITDRCKVHW